MKKEKEVEEERENIKHKLNSERKKALQAHEGYARVKEDYDQQKVLAIHEINEKDKLISALSKQLQETHQIQEYNNNSKSNLPSIIKIQKYIGTYTVHTEEDFISFKDKRKSCIAGINNANNTEKKIGKTLLQHLKKYLNL